MIKSPSPERRETFVRPQYNLNVFKLGVDYSPNPFRRLWRNLKLFCRRIKWAYHRATRGYCDFDVWSLCDFYGALLSESLRKLAKDTNGSPHPLTIDEWRETLTYMADCFAESTDDALLADTPEWKVYHDLVEPLRKKKELEDGSVICEVPSNEELQKHPEIIAAHEAWINDVKRRNARIRQMKNRGLNLLKEWFYDLWW